ncbi:endonuclease/exonuclease/phosphatase family protein, partial [Salmonella enterica]|uniref:endonuclease/exonuclease/phosphatase family protein n=1 Tax=Salmonella enterica TaxID=28901 RepID=UPI0032B5C793
MRLATWNVNSIRARVGRIVDFAVRESVDVLAMQEIKCKAEQFPYAAFEEAGYHVAAHGFSQWNGVAIASREPIADVETAFPGM